MEPKTTSEQDQPAINNAQSGSDSPVNSDSTSNSSSEVNSETIPPLVDTSTQSPESIAKPPVNNEIEDNEELAEIGKVKIKKRNTISAVFDEYEFPYVHSVYEARNKEISKKTGKPLSKDFNQFIRQCVNFAINHEEDWTFANPSTEKKVYIN